MARPKGSKNKIQNWRKDYYLSLDERIVNMATVQAAKEGSKFIPFVEQALEYTVSNADNALRAITNPQAQKRTLPLTIRITPETRDELENASIDLDSSIYAVSESLMNGISDFRLIKTLTVLSQDTGIDIATILLDGLELLVEKIKAINSEGQDTQK